MLIFKLKICQMSLFHCGWLMCPKSMSLMYILCGRKSLFRSVFVLCVFVFFFILFYANYQFLKIIHYTNKIHTPRKHTFNGYVCLFISVQFCISVLFLFFFCHISLMRATISGTSELNLNSFIEMFLDIFRI